MTIAISAHGETLDAMVDDRFGRAQYLLFVSDGGELLDAVDNTANRNALQGAGIGTAESVAERSATAVLTGHLGPKAMNALSSVGIRGYEASGMSVAEAVERFMAGELAPIDVAAPAHSS